MIKYISKFRIKAAKNAEWRETMGKTKKSTGKRKKKVKQDAYVHAIIMMILSIALAVLIYGKTGSIGRGLSGVTRRFTSGGLSIFCQ